MYFADTSALVKLEVQEPHSEDVASLLTSADAVLTSVVAWPEYVSALERRRRTGGVTPEAYPDRLFRSRPHADVAPWLELALGVSFLRRDLENAAKSTAGHQRISQGDLVRFPVPVPPVPEQRPSVRAVAEVMSAVASLSANAGTAIADLDTLNQAILAKAFRGELVPQDPNDEPAEKLLERITVSQGSDAAARPRKQRGQRARA